MVCKECDFFCCCCLKFSEIEAVCYSQSFQKQLETDLSAVRGAQSPTQAGGAALRPKDRPGAGSAPTPSASRRSRTEGCKPGPAFPGAGAAAAPLPGGSPHALVPSLGTPLPRCPVAPSPPRPARPRLAAVSALFSNSGSPPSRNYNPQDALRRHPPSEHARASQRARRAGVAAPLRQALPPPRSRTLLW